MLEEVEMPEKTTHFGFKTVEVEEKQGLVRGVFDSVASNYDIMNDVMSLGLHRLWKRVAIDLSGAREGQRILDIAGGTGDLSRRFAKKVGTAGEVWLTDINYNMLSVGRDKLCDQGMILPVTLCNAEFLPFPDNYFDCVSVAFGLRNMTHKENALAEMLRVIRPGGRVLVLEFSQVYTPLRPIYDAYSFNLLPIMGKFIAKDEESYRYLAESIRMHPDQETLAALMRNVGFEKVEYHNLSAGIVAIHRGFKF